MSFIKSLKFVFESYIYYFDRLKDIIIGVDFIKPYANNKIYGVKYYISSSSGGSKIKNIFKTLSINENDSILDIGCGKGRAINIMRRFPFKKIDGIEFIEELCNTATKNFKILNERRVDIYCCDATLFSNYNDYNYFYLYNPFSIEIIEKMITLINQSCIDSPRQIKVIYVNAIGDNSFKNNGYNKILESIDEFGNNIFVYQLKL